jgi:hypothetical protein
MFFATVTTTLAKLIIRKFYSFIIFEMRRNKGSLEFLSEKVGVHAIRGKLSSGKKFFALLAYFPVYIFSTKFQMFLNGIQVFLFVAIPY